MAIFWRIWATSAGVIFVVLATFLALSIVQFSRMHSGLVGERLVVLADRTAAPFESAARLGLPIADMRNADGILERARQTDERITGIFVFDGDGRIVHQTRGDVKSEDAQAALRAGSSNMRSWYGQIDAGFVAGVNIPAAQGKPAGGVVVLYPYTGSTTRVWAMAAELAVVALGIFALSMVIAGLLLRTGLRRTVATFDLIDGEIAAFERDSWRGTNWGERVDGLRGQLDASFEQYRAAVAGLRPKTDGPRQ